jgi:adenylate cyclase
VGRVPAPIGHIAKKDSKRLPLRSKLLSDQTRTPEMNESAHSLTKTILEMDLVAYSDVARLLEENLNVEAVKIFQDQIQQFVDYGLSVVGLRRDEVVIDTAGGDNAILMFDDSETTHKFAQAVQTQTLVHNSAKSIESAKRWFRMGAATGIVLIMPAERRIFGSTITRAVRLEAAAEIGQLVVDLPTFDTLSEELKKAYSSTDIITGKRTERFEGRRCTLIDVPKIEQAVASPLIRRPETKARSSTPSPAFLDDRPAIAVLPFSSIGGDASQAYLSDGITEDIINELASWRFFPVIARSSMIFFKGQDVDISQMRKKTGARYFVEGSINKIGRRIRISARLVDAVTGRQLASERFDRDLEELPEIQNVIAETIVGSIAPEVLRIERHRVRRKARKNNTSYEYFLRGLEAHYRYTKTDNAVAQRHFRRAIETDAQNAQAHALLASAIMQAVLLGWREDDHHNHAVADQLAQRAVALDPRAPVAHFSLGSSSMFLGRIEEALMEMREAIRLNPSYAAAHAIMASLLCYVGRANDALDCARRALSLSPYDPRLGLWLSSVSQAQYFLRVYEEAAVMGQHALSLISENPLAHRFAAASLGQLGRTIEAEAIVLTIRQSPTPSIEAIRKSVVHLYRDEQMIEHMLDGLRKAGLQ